LFYNDTFVDVLFRGLDSDRKSSRCLPNTSTFVPNDRPQSVYCVLPIMQCAFGAHIDVGLSRSDQPRADSLEISRFLPSFLGKMAVFAKTESLCLPNTSTFVPNDRSQCLYFVLPIMRCAFGAHLDVGLAERQTPYRFVGNLTFPSLFLGEDDRI
jgi:hypothetical protein